jgi:hypothetical protein
LRPLADDIDDDVLCFLFEEITTSGSTSFSSIEETLLTYIPLFVDLSTDHRRSIVQRTQALLKKESDTSSTTLLDDLYDSKKIQTIQTSQTSNSRGSDHFNKDDIHAVTLSEAEILMLSAKTSDIPPLQALFPDLKEEHLRFALGSTGGASSTIEKAASFLLENDIESLVRDAKKEVDRRRSTEYAKAKALVAKEEQVKASALARYDEQIDDKDKRYRPTLPPEMLVSHPKGAKVIKFLDGKAIYMKPSEKFFIEKDEDTASSALPPPTTLKIKKKGQGGASPGFKK